MEPSTRRLPPDHREAPVRFDAGLVERAVLEAIERAPAAERRRFRRERDPIYELGAEAEREAGFRALHALWFRRLRLAEPLRSLLGEQPSIPPSIAACLVAPAERRSQEHADLRRPQGAGASAAGARPVLVVRLLAPTLVDPERLGRLLRRELLYVADMLDPVFGYDPEAAVQETSGPLAAVLRERHELLWRVIVDGRLAARGHLDPREAERLRWRFEAAFPRSGRSCAVTFRSLFEGPRPEHRELVRLARHAGAAGSAAGGECPLCRMPVPRGSPARATLSAAALDAVRLDFPDWQPRDGICPHCTDLYGSRVLAGKD